MRLTAAEKHEIIRLVEGSDLSVRRTLRELGVHRSTFYAWYRRYQAVGAAGLVPRPSAARRHWNRIPLRVRHRVVEAALADPVKSTPRAGVAVHGSGAPLSLGVQRVSHPQSRGSDHQSGVCGALGGQDICSSDGPAQRVVANRLHLPAGCRGGAGYYLSTVLDDYSRYILAWTLRGDVPCAVEIQRRLGSRLRDHR